MTLRRNVLSCLFLCHLQTWSWSTLSFVLCGPWTMVFTWSTLSCLFFAWPPLGPLGVAQGMDKASPSTCSMQNTRSRQPIGVCVNACNPKPHISLYFLMLHDASCFLFMEVAGKSSSIKHANWNGDCLEKAVKGCPSLQDEYSSSACLSLSTAPSMSLPVHRLLLLLPYFWFTVTGLNQCRHENVHRLVRVDGRDDAQVASRASMTATRIHIIKVSRRGMKLVEF